MKKNTINIQNEANINAKGKFNSRHCKPVICLETGEVFSSVADAAEAIGCVANNLSTHLTGKLRSVKGKHFCYLSRVNESLDVIITRLRETAAVEEDAKRWQAYQAEQEAIRQEEERRAAEARKAEEKRIAELEKARAKVAKLTASCANLEEQWHAKMAELLEAEKALEALVGNENAEGVAA